MIPTNAELRAISAEKKRWAATLIRSAKVNGDIKNMHLFCAAIGISTSIYRDVMAGADVFSFEKALTIIDNIEKIQRKEIVIPRAKKKEEPDLAEMLKEVAHAGKRAE
jgi:hypothetical protein